MTATLERRSVEVDQAREHLTALARQLGEIEDIPAALDALDATKAIQSLVKIRKLAADVAHDAIWLEALCLRRLGGIPDYDGLIPNALRPCTAHFAPLSDVELRTLLDEYPSSTALGSYRRAMKAASNDGERARGARWATGEDCYQPGDIGADVAHYSRNVRAAAAALLNELTIDGGAALSVAQMADLLIEEHYSDDYRAGDAAFRAGVAQVVSQVMRSAEYPETEFWKIPRFITCMTPDGDWLRLPIEIATVGQYKQMLAARAKQIADSQQALDRLRQIGAREGLLERSDAEVLFGGGIS